SVRPLFGLIFYVATECSIAPGRFFGSYGSAGAVAAAVATIRQPRGSNPFAGAVAGCVTKFRGERTKFANVGFRDARAIFSRRTNATAVGALSPAAKLLTGRRRTCKLHEPFTDGPGIPMANLATERQRQSSCWERNGLFNRCCTT